MSFEKKPRRVIFGIGMRLTIWGAGLTTLLCAILSGALYAGVYFSFQSQIDAFLKGEITEFMQTVNEHPRDDVGLEAAIRRELGVREARDLMFRLIDERGETLVSSAENDPLAGTWTPRPDSRNADSRVHCEVVRPANQSDGYRVCSLSVRTSDGRICTAQSSYLLRQMNESLATFRRIVAMVLFLALFVALGVGGFLARRSLQPIRGLMKTARSIGSRDLRKRIPLSGSGDEMDQLAATLNGMLDRIEGQVREIQRFTADASHELRTPLAALRGNAEVALSRSRSGEELRRTIEDSIEQYDRLQRIAEDLLLLARYDAGETSVRRETISLDRIVADVMDLYLPTADEKGLSLSMVKSEPLFVKGDGGRLRQVFGNLVDNAIKYTQPGGQVFVSLARKNGVVRTEIEDTGIGISAEDLPRVFDRFFRSDPSRSNQSATGVGLGLSICRSIIEAHGGTVAVKSELGAGTLVRVSLPVEGVDQDNAFTRDSQSPDQLA